MANKGVNKVILVGYLGKDPDVRYTSDGKTVTNFSVATTDSWKDKQTNEFKERTEWHRIVLFGKLAEIAAEYLQKGSQVYLEGSLHTRKWKNQNGQDRYTTEIIVGIRGSFQMLGARNLKESSNVQLPDMSDKNIEGNTILSDEIPEVNIDNDEIPF